MPGHHMFESYIFKDCPEVQQLVNDEKSRLTASHKLEISKLQSKISEALSQSEKLQSTAEADKKLLEGQINAMSEKVKSLSNDHEQKVKKMRRDNEGTRRYFKADWSTYRPKLTGAIHTLAISQ